MTDALKLWDFGGNHAICVSSD